MNVITFEWDREHQRIKRTPESPVATREENMRAAAAVRNIMGDDATARDLARYETAKAAYDSRAWYQPITEVVDGHGPSFLHAADIPPRVYDTMRDSLRKLSSLQSEPARLARLLTEEPELQDAVALNEYAFRVAACEGYNESCCAVLLMSHAWLAELNPEGDAAAIELLRELLINWFRISDPASTAPERHAQAARAAHNFRWLSDAWRRVWGNP